MSTVIVSAAWKGSPRRRISAQQKSKRNTLAQCEMHIFRRRRRWFVASPPPTCLILGSAQDNYFRIASTSATNGGGNADILAVAHHAAPRCVARITFRYCPVDNSNVPFGNTPCRVLSQICNAAHSFT